MTAVCPGFTYSEFHDVTGTRDRMNKMPGLLWLNATDVAREGYDAVMRGDPVIVNGRIYQLLVWLNGALPRSLARWVAGLADGAIARPELRPGHRKVRYGRDTAQRHSLRTALDGAQPRLRRSPSLGLGVGVNTAMFSLVDSLLFRPLPVTSPETLVDVFTTGGDGDEYATSSYQDFLDLKQQNTVFSDMLGYSPMMAPLSLGDRSRIALGQVVTSNHFTMLGVQPALGRLLVPSDDDPGAERVVVIAHRMWQRSSEAIRPLPGRR